MPTSEKMAHLASEIMHDAGASQLEKSLAGSVLSEAEPGRLPSPELINLAQQVMANRKDFSKNCVELAETIIKLGK